MRRIHPIYLLPFLILVMLLTVALVGLNLTSAQRIAATLLSYDSSRHPEPEWIKIGRDTAQAFGMVGAPEREEWAIMTRGSYLTMTGNGGISQNRSEPVFVYQAFGTIPTFTMYGLDGARTDIGGMTLLFDGTAGILTNWTAYPQSVIAHGSAGLDLSFIPADLGLDQDSLENLIPTLAQ